MQARCTSCAAGFCCWTGRAGGIASIQKLVKILTCVLLFLCLAASAQIYKREESLPPLRMNYDQLQSTIEGIRKIIMDANKDCTAAGEESLELEHAGRQVSITNYSANSMQKQMPYASAATYNFYAGGFFGCPLSKVQLYLKDGFRWVSATGTDGKSVDAVVAQAQFYLRDCKSYGGVAWRSVFGTVLVILGSLINWMAGSLPDKAYGARVSLYVVGCSMIGGSMFGTWWGNILPGTAIFAGDGIISRTQ